MEIGAKIAYIRAVRNLSQKELAERTGVRQDTVSNIETGKQRPQTRTLLRLAEALEAVPTWFDDSVTAEDLRTFVAATRFVRARQPKPVYDIHASFDYNWVGDEIPPEQESDDALEQESEGPDYFPAPPGRLYPDGFWARICDNSQEPLLLEGDMLFFSPEVTVDPVGQSGRLCLVRTHNYGCVRLVYGFGFQHPRLRLRCVNPKYSELSVDLEADVAQVLPAITMLKRVPERLRFAPY